MSFSRYKKKTWFSILIVGWLTTWLYVLLQTKWQNKNKDNKVVKVKTALTICDDQ